MKVRELIEHLKTFDPELPVVYRLWSEQVLIEHDDIKVKLLCQPRPDGWVANERSDQPSIEYLVLP